VFWCVLQCVAGDATRFVTALFVRVCIDVATTLDLIVAVCLAVQCVLQSQYAYIGSPSQHETFVTWIALSFRTLSRITCVSLFS